MIQDMQIVNSSTLDSVTLGQTQDAEYFLETVDWGAPTASHNTYSFPGQVGVSISNTNIKSRDIVITGYVWEFIDKNDYPDLTNEQIAAMRYSAILSKKSALSAIINPEQPTILRIGNFFIEGNPSKPVLFGKTDAENNKVMCKFQIYLFCADPMFKKKASTETLLSQSVPKFRFPLVIKSTGLVMSVRTNYQLITFLNEGSVAIGAVFTIKALGPITDITIENVYAGDWMKITKSLVAGESIVIDTRKGVKSITGTLDGVSSNYFKYWDYEGEWLEFQPGTAIVGYSLASGDEALIDVRISSYPKFYSLEEM